MKCSKYDRHGRDKKGQLEVKPGPWLPCFGALLRGTQKRKDRLGLMGRVYTNTCCRMNRSEIIDMTLVADHRRRYRARLLWSGARRHGLARRIWALVGNSTGMVIVAVLLFLFAWQLQSMHSEEIGTLRQLHIEERDFNRQTLRGLGAVIERNSSAIDGLAGEIAKLRKAP